MKHYYLRIDTTVSKQNPGFGFCNSKKIMAFKSFDLREKALEFFREFDFSCQSLTRKQALKDTASHELNYKNDRVIPIYATIEDAHSRSCHIHNEEIITLECR
jgi:hypothetical protein